MPESGSATTLAEAQKVAKKIGYPLMVRAAFTLGGQKSGVAHNAKELKEIVNGALVVALSEGNDLEQAIEFACKAAAISVTRMGAQASAPFRSEVNF